MDGKIFGLIGLACAVRVIYDVLKNQPSFSTDRKVLWIILAVLFSVVTAIVYYFTVKAKV